MDRGWMRDALCAESHPDLWFPEHAHTFENRQARMICERCPVREQCLEYALVNGENEGIWGGLLPRERRLLKRKMRK